MTATVTRAMTYCATFIAAEKIAGAMLDIVGANLVGFMTAHGCTSIPPLPPPRAVIYCATFIDAGKKSRGNASSGRSLHDRTLVYINTTTSPADEDQAMSEFQTAHQQTNDSTNCKVKYGAHHMHNAAINPSPSSCSSSSSSNNSSPTPSSNDAIMTMTQNNDCRSSSQSGSNTNNDNDSPNILPQSNENENETPLNEATNTMTMSMKISMRNTAQSQSQSNFHDTSAPQDVTTTRCTLAEQGVKAIQS
jgi:hypothetical protein